MLSTLPVVSDAPAAQPPAQLLLPGFSYLSSPDGFFLALLPDASLCHRIAELTLALRRDHQLRGRPIGPDRLHVSLHDLTPHATTGSDLAVLVSEAAATLRTRPFTVMFDRVLSFRRTRAQQAFVLRSSDELPALQDFRRQLGFSLSQVGLGVHGFSSFTPHLTLLYDTHTVAEHPVDPIVWTVTQFALVHSLRGRSQYRILHRWPLAP